MNLELRKKMFLLNSVQVTTRAMEKWYNDNNNNNNNNINNNRN